MFPMGDSFAQVRPPIRLTDPGGLVMQHAVGLLNGNPEEYGRILEVVRVGLDGAIVATQRWLDDSSLDPMLRWSMLHVLSDVADPGTLEVLHRQAARRLPERRQEEGVCEHAADIEELVNVMAIEGLGVLARSGVGDAVDALFDVLANQDRRSLRRPALAELLSVNPDFRDRAADLLPDEDRYLLELRIAIEDDISVVLDERDPRRRLPRRSADKPRLSRRDPRRPSPLPNNGGE